MLYGRYKPPVECISARLPLLGVVFTLCPFLAGPFSQGIRHDEDPKAETSGCRRNPTKIIIYCNQCRETTGHQHEDLTGWTRKHTGKDKTIYTDG